MHYTQQITSNVKVFKAEYSWLTNVILAETINIHKAYMDWKTHVMYDDTYTFLKRMDKYYFGLYGEEVPKYVKNQKKSKRRKRNRGVKGRKCNAIRTA